MLVDELDAQVAAILEEPAHGTEEQISQLEAAYTVLSQALQQD